MGNPSPYRERIVRAAGERFQVSARRGVFHAALAALLARAKMVLNIHRSPLRNFECRVIETLGCGAFLLTEALEPDDVFRDGEHLAVFNEGNLLEAAGALPWRRCGPAADRSGGPRGGREV